MERVCQLLQQHIYKMSQISSYNSESFDSFHIDERELICIAEKTTCIFGKEPNILKIDPPLVIVGDLHGQIQDLYRILTRFDLPPRQKYLFLGDLVDRGDYSIEVVSLIFVLKVLYPKNVYIIRGNHEFRNVSFTGGFYSEIMKKYKNNQIYEAFINSFNYLPFAAKVGSYFCVHGGISPEIISISQIENLKRPIFTYQDPILTGILWSDPTLENLYFGPSPRGHGSLFGNTALIDFLTNNNLTCLIRAHECVNGVKVLFNNLLYTVFSASNYPGGGENPSGTLFINENFKITPIEFLSYSKEIEENNNIINNSLKKKQNQSIFIKKPVLQITCGTNTSFKLNLDQNQPNFIRNRIQLYRGNSESFLYC